VIKTQLRKLDNDITNNISKLSAKFKASVKESKDELYEKIDSVEAHLRGEIILV
jgi:gas vesicle protein